MCWTIWIEKWLRLYFHYDVLIISVPPEFPFPTVHKVTDGHVVLRLHRTSEIVGKIKSYWLILAEEQFIVNKYPGNMTIEQVRVIRLQDLREILK